MKSVNKNQLDKHLHIIALNVPYPVDYGGVFDLFYKLSALKNQGLKIHLHCFKYGREEQPELEKYCESVDYYQRKRGLSGLALKYPYIVSSRKSKPLLDKLLKDDYPILMEGIHCTYLLDDKRFDSRKRFVRLHNVEHIYYKHLSKNTPSPFKKIYYVIESKLLYRYEKAISGKATFWSVTEKDAEIYRALGCEKTDFLPLFLPEWRVKANEGNGSFCLYQGDLSVTENEKAAAWLVDHIFNDLKIPFVVAGKNPSRRLQKKLHGNNLTCLIPNPSDDEMQDLISKAHINIIPSFNSTGIKLKLINALFNGRFCVVNEQAVSGTNLEKACHVATEANAFKSAIKKLYTLPFGHEDLQTRHDVLDNMFNNEKNAIQMVRWIFG